MSRWTISKFERLTFPNMADNLNNNFIWNLIFVISGHFDANLNLVLQCRHCNVCWLRDKIGLTKIRREKVPLNAKVLGNWTCDISKLYEK